MLAEMIVTEFLQPSEILTYVPKWPLYIFLAAAVFCLGSSAVYHTFHIVSEPWMDFFSRLDYSGIAILICGSAYPPITYSFACQ